MKKKPRQPIAQIGAQTLWKLAMAAQNDVFNGDQDNPYVSEITKLANRAADIAWRRLKAKGMKPEASK